ncbi:hypothetical protein FHG87_006705, partial [Trinorchestia longiramus]
DVLRPLLVQGGLRPFHGTRVQLLLSLWFLHCFIISAYYSGVLYMHLTVVEEEKAVDNVEDLVQRLEKGNFEVSLARGSFPVEVLRTNGEGTLGKIEAFEKESWFQYQNFDEVLDIIGNDSSWSTFTGATSMSVRVAARGAWKYHLSRESYIPNALGIVARKNSPLIPAINHVLKYVRSSGLINHWLTRIRSEKENRMERPTANTLIQLTLSHLAVGFVALAVGFCLATLVFLVEM